MNSEDYSFSTKTGAVFKEPNAEGGYTVKGDSLEGYYSVYHGNTPKECASAVDTEPLKSVDIVATDVKESLGEDVALASSVTPLEASPSKSVEEKVEITTSQEENVSEDVSEATTEEETKPKKKNTKTPTSKE